MRVFRLLALVAVVAGLGAWSLVEAQPNTAVSYQAVNGGQVSTIKVQWHKKDSTYAGQSRALYADSTTIVATGADTSRWYPIAGLDAASVFYKSAARTAGANPDSTNLLFSFQVTADTSLGTDYYATLPYTHTKTSNATTTQRGQWVFYATAANSDTTNIGANIPRVQSARWGRLVLTGQAEAGDTTDVHAMLNLVFSPNPGGGGGTPRYGY